MRLIYHPDAATKLIQAAQFYEQCMQTLGMQFLDAADLAIAAIQDDPERWSLIEEEIRRYLTPRFPYMIYYRLLPEEIRILAFKHHSRHPDYWRYRISA